jgi:hypothetical protein
MIEDTLLTPGEVAEILRTSTGKLGNDRYRGVGPKFIKVGKRVLYRRSDVRAYLDANTCQRTDDPRGVGVACPA